MDRKVRLAVAAHVRHCQTDYNKLIRETRDRVKARKAVSMDVSRKLQEWRVGLGKATNPITKVPPKKLARKLDEPRKAKPVMKKRTLNTTKSPRKRIEKHAAKAENAIGDVPSDQSK
ncbi:hypothetical protein S7711_11224 [Stachybotrys chartarum IBT 7711]|uniref:DUF2293 domain-containing protein n=1 Tax=Stachybotrys chartarum (strain CBS 109288 / IBT 7711) TaxID=1280523 RepID=A0A084ANL1_STACB|nr:hypothetical protein S7711_11224 [Stachybotrys chartarum IBT 7711]KFA54845.1 hypothetical protein S40293_10418 [Stachybotrys chartarum IBT 40293]